MGEGGGGVGVSQVASGIWLQLRASTPKHLCVQIIHRENLNIHDIYLYRVIISNDKNYYVG